ncbi:hypothetical protein B6U99_05605 [Candidatus Geothermarchaeota archaeon ex4572_27]|nr:MAG: hypothetical protein B6U99_05605 [Candidatus Geothermarchaeota archaeon ex4572_27]
MASTSPRNSVPYLYRLRRLLEQAAARLVPPGLRPKALRLAQYLASPWHGEVGGEVRWLVRSVGVMLLKHEGIDLSHYELRLVAEAFSSAGLRCWVTELSFNLEVPEALMHAAPSSGEHVRKEGTRAR